MPWSSLPSRTPAAVRSCIFLCKLATSSCVTAASPTSYRMGNYTWCGRRLNRRYIRNDVSKILKRFIILETAPHSQGSRRLQSSFPKIGSQNEKIANLQKSVRFFEIFIIFAHPCLRPPQNLVLFLEAGEGPGKSGSALEGVGGCRGHPWSAQKQNKKKSQKSISVIFRYFREFCSSPLPVLFTEAE